jgi:hypothetical protein
MAGARVEMENMLEGGDARSHAVSGRSPDSDFDDVRDVAMDAPRHRAKVVAGAVATLLVMAGVACFELGRKSVAGDVASVQDKYATAAALQPGWQVTTSERDMCAGVKENCFLSKCCKTTGYRCFEIAGINQAKCMKNCTVGKDSPNCNLPASQITFDGKPGDSLYCFSVYTGNTGSTKKSHEKELLALQVKKKVSIFACGAAEVFSDVQVSLGSGVSTIKVDDVEGDFHFAKRKTTGAWVNTGLFKQVWKAVARSGKYHTYPWVVKVDPDAVFLPKRLITRIQYMPRPQSGVVLVNCKHVDNGFFGSIEVFSTMAFDVLAANIDTCSKTLPWKIGVKNGKYGPMGEDLFAEKCLEKNGVAKAEAFDLSADGACPADRPLDQAKNKKWKADCATIKTPAIHPFKKPAEWDACFKATSQITE